MRALNALALAALVLASCKAPVSPPVDAARASVERWRERRLLAARLTAEQARRVSDLDSRGSESIDLPPPEVVGIELRDGMLEPELVPKVPRRTRVRLPATADRPFSLRDEQTGLAIEVKLAGASNVTAEVVDGVVVYRGAAGGADLVHRITGAGTEDFIWIESGSEARELRYDVALAERVAGLRLVSNVLEFLDESGTPRLRVGSPYVIDALGARHDARLALRGCAYDADPAPPWRRATTPPGARRCDVRVSWPEGVRTPALVDPEWVSTGDMAVARAGPQFVPLSADRAIAIGGLGAGALDSAEIYDANTRTWATTGSMAQARTSHRASVLPDGRVLVSGGLTSTILASTEIWSPATGTWSPAGNLSVGRYRHMAVTLPSGSVLVAGGLTSTEGTTAKADLFDPATLQWRATSSMREARDGAGAAWVPSLGAVLVAGGYTKASPTATVELYRSASGWEYTAPMPAARALPVLATLENGSILVAGGTSGSGIYPLSGVRFDPALRSWSNAGSYSPDHWQPTLTPYQSGALLAGGCCPADAVNQFDPSKNTWTTGPSLQVPRSNHGAVTLRGLVHVTGGSTGTVRLASTEYLGGRPCASTADCPVGTCVDGYCCDTPCGGACDRCDLPGIEGSCSPAPIGQSGAPSCGPFACDGVNDGCPATCTSSLQCAAGHHCEAGTCVPPSSLGSVCTVGTDCSSGFCADGRCCDSSCAGGCDRCDLPATVGACTTLAAGSAGLCGGYLCQGAATCPTSCSADDDCGPMFFCNGSSQCAARRPNGASCARPPECTSGVCADGVCCDRACGEACDRCNQSGSIGTCTTASAGYSGFQPSCFPYTCNGTSLACPSTCTSTSQCTAGHHCEGGACVPPSPLGATCVANGDCQSGFCVDGRCCNTACASACDRCDLTGVAGTCTVLAAGEVGACSPYRCGGSATCPASCSTNGQCTPGFWCEASRCVPTRATGSPCFSAAQCSSGSCVEGFCCDSACDGACDSCGISGFAGTCRAVASGTSVAECSPYLCDGSNATCPTTCTSSAQCATGHYCAPSGRCEPKLTLRTSCSQNDACASGFCADGVCCSSSCTGGCNRCDLEGTKGTCTAVPKGTVGDACGRYLCAGSGAACPTTCSDDSGCTTDSWCNGGACVAKLVDAASCTRNAQCVSGSCADGVCCDTACAGGCDRCDAPQSPGRCTLVGAGSPGTCAGPLCDGTSAACPASCGSDAQCAPGYWCGSGTCQARRAKGERCVQARECASGFCADGVCCDGPCGGACDRCDAGTSMGTCSPAPLGEPGAPACAPYACDGSAASCPSVCTSDAGCASGLICEGSACVPKLAAGRACASGARCASGFCVDGVCCGSPCDRGCDRCNLPGREGACVAAPAGTRGESPACDPYLCDGTSTACPSSCTNDSECAEGRHCGGGACVEKRSSGMPCTRAAECSSAVCADGVCCARACDGACARCDTPGSQGFCRPKAPGAPSDGDTCSPFTCDGVNDGCPSTCASDAGCIAGRYCQGGACLAKREAGASCAAARECASGFCADGVCCNRACDGACNRCDLTGSRGACAPAPAGDPGAPSCAPRVCDGASAACPTTCTGTSGCAANAYCAANACLVRQSIGTTCGANEQCASGFCIDGVCCENACAGQCASCALAGQRGLCRAVTGSPAGGRPPCAGDGSACEGRCDGLKLGACSYPGPATVCRAPSCAAGTATARAVCDGTGLCPPMSTKDCAPLVCGANACVGECAEDRDCVPGTWCTEGRCESKRALGEACTAANACASGFCSDGRCCDGFCSGSCDRCDLAGAEGRCTLLAAGDAAEGACAPLRCDGAHAACPDACAEDADCLAGDRCAAGECVARLSIGVACASGTACASGYCVDGVCCESACEGACAACNLPGRAGRCGYVVGEPMAGRGRCAGSGVCEGECRGDGPACAFPGDAATCSPGFCTDGIAVARSACDGTGACVPGAIETCASGACSGNACEPPGPDKPFTPYGGCSSAPTAAPALLAGLVLAACRRRRRGRGVEDVTKRARPE